MLYIFGRNITEETCVILSAYQEAHDVIFVPITGDNNFDRLPNVSR